MTPKVAPFLCSTFKGVLPSDLYERYNTENGYQLFEFDVLVAKEISDRIEEQTKEITKKHDAKSAVARRNQRRKERESISGKQMNNIMDNWLGDKNGEG